ncbi:MAG: hypothetical protein AAF432_11025 [Planctomycetota bacterium]
MAKETSFTHDADAITAHQGLVADSADPIRLDAIIDHAVNYRGDVQITVHSTGDIIEGFAFDRAPARDGQPSMLRVMPKNDDAKIAISCDDIARLELTGKDTAAGKSFETWVKKYVEKKLAGQTASIESESLDDD